MTNVLSFVPDQIRGGRRPWLGGQGWLDSGQSSRRFCWRQACCNSWDRLPAKDPNGAGYAGDDTNRQERGQCNYARSPQATLATRARLAPAHNKLETR